MALIKCCECGQEVSEYADKCPNCGCPIEKIKEVTLLNDDNKVVCIINDKPIDISWIKNELLSLEEDKFDYYKFYCSPEMDGVKATTKHLNDKYFRDASNFNRKVYNYLDLTPNPARAFLYQFIESDYTLKEFDGESLTKANERDINRMMSKPKCPTCGSTNLSKISVTKKATKVGLFGIFGAGDIGKTWKCNNCGSKF